MSCKPVDSIAAALRACNPCPAAPPARNWVLADRVSESRAQPGMVIDVRLNGVDARDSLGRIAHVRGIYIKAIGEFTLGATNDAVPAYQLRSLFYALMLEDVTGHAYWPSLDARTLLDDTFFRHWANIQWPFMRTGTQGPNQYFPTGTADYGLATNVGAGATTRELSTYLPLSALGVGLNPFADLIPLAALQRQSSQGSFRFRLGTTIAGTPDGVTFDGVLNGEGNAGLDVWLDLVYLPALAVSPTWTVDNYTLPDSSGILRRPESSTELAVVRYFPEDNADSEVATPGQLGVNDLDTVTLKVAGYTIMNGLSQADWFQRQEIFYASERDSALTRANAEQDLPMANGSGALALVLLPYRQKGTGEASGDVNYKIQNMGGQPLIRFLHRTKDCNEAERAQEIGQALECDPCSKTIVTDPKGQPTATPTTAGTILVLDRRISRA